MTSSGEGCLPRVEKKEKRRSLLQAPKSYKLCVPKPDTTADSAPESQSKEEIPCIGDKVCIGGVKTGILRFCGETHFAKGEWCGIELSEKEGKHNGSVDGVHYFTCPTNCGIFAPSHKVTSITRSDLSSVNHNKNVPVCGTANTDGSRLKEPSSHRSTSPVEPKSPEPQPKASKLARPKHFGKNKKKLIRKDDNSSTSSSRDSSLSRDTARPHSAKSNPRELPVESNAKLKQKSHGDRTEETHEIGRTASDTKLISKQVNHDLCFGKTFTVEPETVTPWDEYDDEIIEVITPSRVDIHTALTLAYCLESSCSDTELSKDSLDDNTDKNKDKENNIPTGFPSKSSLPDLIRNTGKMPPPEKVSPLELESSEAFGDSQASLLSHASSLGILSDLELCNNNLLGEECRDSNRGQEDFQGNRVVEDLLEKEIDRAIADVCTPDVDMSSSTISKEAAFSPDAESAPKRSLELTFEIAPGKTSTPASPNRTGVSAGEKMATPVFGNGFAVSQLSGTETANATYSLTSLVGPESQQHLTLGAKNKTYIVEESEEESCLSDLIGTKPPGEDEIDLDDGQLNSSFELAKAAVAQYADLVQGARREHAQHLAREVERSQATHAHLHKPARTDQASETLTDEFAEEIVNDTTVLESEHCLEADSTVLEQTDLAMEKTVLMETVDNFDEAVVFTKDVIQPISDPTDQGGHLESNTSLDSEKLQEITPGFSVQQPEISCSSPIHEDFHETSMDSFVVIESYQAECISKDTADQDILVHDTASAKLLPDYNTLLKTENSTELGKTKALDDIMTEHATELSKTNDITDQKMKTSTVEPSEAKVTDEITKPKQFSELKTTDTELSETKAVVDGLIKAELSTELSETKNMVDGLIKSEPSTELSETKAVVDGLIKAEPSTELSETKAVVDGLIKAEPSTELSETKNMVDGLESEPSTELSETKAVVDGLIKAEPSTELSETKNMVDGLIKAEPSTELSETKDIVDGLIKAEPSTELSETKNMADGLIKAEPSKDVSETKAVVDGLIKSETSTELNEAKAIVDDVINTRCSTELSKSDELNDDVIKTEHTEELSKTKDIVTDVIETEPSTELSKTNDMVDDVIKSEHTTERNKTNGIVDGIINTKPSTEFVKSEHTTELSKTEDTVSDVIETEIPSELSKIKATVDDVMKADDTIEHNKTKDYIDEETFPCKPTNFDRDKSDYARIAETVNEADLKIGLEKDQIVTDLSVGMTTYDAFSSTISKDDVMPVSTADAKLLEDLESGLVKKERPVSMISTTSTDTGIEADIHIVGDKRERPLSMLSTSSLDYEVIPEMMLSEKRERPLSGISFGSVDTGIMTSSMLSTSSVDTGIASDISESTRRRDKLLTSSTSIETTGMTMSTMSTVSSDAGIVADAAEVVAKDDDQCFLMSASQVEQDNDGVIKGADQIADDTEFFLGEDATLINAVDSDQTEKTPVEPDTILGKSTEDREKKEGDDTMEDISDTEREREDEMEENENEANSTIIQDTIKDGPSEVTMCEENVGPADVTAAITPAVTASQNQGYGPCEDLSRDLEKLPRESSPHVTHSQPDHEVESDTNWQHPAELDPRAHSLTETENQKVVAMETDSVDTEEDTDKKTDLPDIPIVEIEIVEAVRVNGIRDSVHDSSFEELQGISHSDLDVQDMEIDQSEEETAMETENKQIVQVKPTTPKKESLLKLKGRKVEKKETTTKPKEPAKGKPVQIKLTKPSPKKKELPDDSSMKKSSKLGSIRPTSYLRKPLSAKVKDDKEAEIANNAKLKKEVNNGKKKAELSKCGPDKKAVKPAEVRRERKISGKQDLNVSTPSAGSKAVISHATDDVSSPSRKSVKRDRPKSKWENIMSQIDSGKAQPKTKPKNDVKVRTNAKSVPTKPAPSRTIGNRTLTPPDKSKAKEKGSRVLSPRPGTPRSNQSLDVHRADSRMSSTSDLTAQEPRSTSKSRISSLPTSKGKPGHKATSALRKVERSPSIGSDSQLSITSQVSSQGSRKAGTKTGGPPRRRTLHEPYPSKIQTSESRKSSIGLTSGNRSINKPSVGKPPGLGSPQITSTPKKTPNQTRKVVKGPPSNNKRVLHQDLSIDKVHESAEVSRLEALCEARTKELNYAKIQLRKQAAGFEAMSVLVNYLANQLDAFSCPEIKAQLHKTQESLIKTQQQLEGLITQRDALVDEIRTLKQDHQEQKEHLEQERDQALQDLESLRVEKEQELEQASKQHDEAISRLNDEHSKEVSEIKQQQEEALEEKQTEYDKRVEQVKEEHTKTLADLKLQHDTRLEEITMRFENIKTTLVEKVEFLRNECEDMRRREKLYMEACKRDTDLKVQAALAPCQHLTQEIDSLKTVLELRNQEIHQLRREKMDFEKEKEELASAKDRIKRLEQEVENLKAIIDIKVEYERQIAEKHQSLLRRYDKESKANKRLSMDNEELVWRLSQSDFGSPDVFNRSLSHSPTNVETITPEGVKLRRHNPPHSPRSPRSPRGPATDLDKSPTTSHTGLKRSSTYDLLDQEFDEEENIKQSDV